MSKSSSTETVKVMVRVRPMNKKEHARGCNSILKVEKTLNQIGITKPEAPNEPSKDFTFDSVYDTDA